MDRGESLGVVADHHRLHPLAEDRLDRLLVGGIGLDHLAHHAEDPAIVRIGGLDAAEVLENRPNPRGGPVHPLPEPGKGGSSRFGGSKLALGAPGRLDRFVERRVRGGERRPGVFPGPLRDLEGLPRRGLGGRRRVEVARSLFHRGGRLFEGPVRKTGHGSFPLRDPLRQRFGAGPRVGVLGHAHDQVGLGALDLFLGEAVLFARRRQRGVLLLPTGPGQGKPLAPPGGFPFRLRDPRVERRDLRFEGGDLHSRLQDHPAELFRLSAKPVPLRLATRRFLLPPAVLVPQVGQQPFPLRQRHPRLFAADVHPRQVGTRGEKRVFDAAQRLPRRVEREGHRETLSGGDAKIEVLQFRAERLVPLRLPDLPFERPDLAPDLVEDVLHAGEVLAGALHLPLRLFPPDPELGDPRGLLDDHAHLVRPGIDDLADLSLGDDGVSAGTGAGVEEQFGDVLQAARNLVDGEFALAVAEGPAGDRDLGVRFVPRRGVPVVVHEGEGHLGHPQGTGGIRAGEDDVFERLAAKIGGGVLAEDPADGVNDVRLAASVRADDRRDPGGKIKRRLVVERLEADQFQFFQFHRYPMPDTTPDRANLYMLCAQTPPSAIYGVFRAM